LARPSGNADNSAATPRLLLAFQRSRSGLSVDALISNVFTDLPCYWNQRDRAAFALMPVLFSDLNSKTNFQVWPNHLEIVLKTFTLSLLATAAFGSVAMSSASAMPFNKIAAGLGESGVQNVRMICDRYGRCYNTRRAVRPYYTQRYQNRPAYYGGEPRYGYAAPGYRQYDRPGVGIGIGPLGVRVY
jgi:hypothetical protein